MNVPQASAAPPVTDIVGSWDDITDAIPGQAPELTGPLVFMSSSKTFLLFTQAGETWMIDPEVNTWQQVAIGSGPGGRSSPGMAYDPVHDEVVLFGGSDYDPVTHTTSYFGDTWTFRNGAWTQRAPAASPSPRDRMVIVSHDALGRVVLFGGNNANELGVDFGVKSDTWTWNGTDWAPLVTAHRPPPRLDTQATYDPLRGELVLFGGLFTTHLNDTWVFDGVDWTQIATAHSPPRRSAGALVFNDELGGAILFGGAGPLQPPAVNPGTVWLDTYLWDGADWQLLPNLELTEGFNDPYAAFDPTTALVLVTSYTPSRPGAQFLLLSTDIATPQPTPQPEPVSMSPVRVLETRAAAGQIGYNGPRPIAGQTVELAISGSNGVPAAAGAVVINVTATGTTGAGYLTAWPCGTPQPNASNLNFVAGQTVANLVIAKLGNTGKICLYTSAGTDLIADLQGWYPPTTTYNTMSPVRVLETRAAAGQIGYNGPRPIAGQTVELAISGNNGVPAAAGAVVINVTATGTSGAGYLIAWPCGTPQPNASNLNFVAGQTVANLVIAKLGNTGKICLYTSAGTDLIADLQGWT